MVTTKLLIYRAVRACNLGIVYRGRVLPRTWWNLLHQRQKKRRRGGGCRKRDLSSTLWQAASCRGEGERREGGGEREVGPLEAADRPRRGKEESGLFFPSNTFPTTTPPHSPTLKTNTHPTPPHPSPSEEDPSREWGRERERRRRRRGGESRKKEGGRERPTLDPLLPVFLKRRTPVLQPSLHFQNNNGRGGRRQVREEGGEQQEQLLVCRCHFASEARLHDFRGRRGW